MESIWIVTSAGLIAASAGVIGYRLGKKQSKRTAKAYHADADGAAQQDALMKKYEAILDYDPYGDCV